jgi:HAAS
MGDLIADYLAEVRRRLPPASWTGDVIAELEDHLQESARTVGPEAALERMGPAPVVADAMIADRTRATVTAGGTMVLLLGLAAGALLAVSGLDVFRGDNPWATTAVPWSLLVSQAVGAVAFQVAVIAIGVAFARHRWYDRSSADCGLVARSTAIAASAFVIGSASVSFSEWQRARLATDLHIPHPLVLGLGVLGIGGLAVAALVVATRAERAARWSPESTAGRSPRLTRTPLRLAHAVADRLPILDPARHPVVAGVLWAAATGGVITLWCASGLGEFPLSQALFSGAVEAVAVLVGLAWLAPMLGIIESPRPA